MTATTRRRTRFPGLDGLRAVGALFVVTTHVGFESGASLNSSFNGILSRMDTGVAIFFVISGFLLYRPHAISLVTGSPGPALRRYLWHRAVRILPPLWIATLAAAVLLPHDARVGVGSYLRHALLVQIYTTGNETNGLTQMWSLATEGAFYLVLPVLAFLVSRRISRLRRAVKVRLWVLLATPALGASWMAVSAASTEPLWGVWLPGYVGWFGIGMALALWHVARDAGLIGRGALDDLGRHPWTVWALAAAVFLLVISPIAGPYDLSSATAGEAATKNVLYGVFGALVVFPATAALSVQDDPPAVRVLGGSVGKFLGDISYGIFCYHLIVLGLVERAIGFEIFTGQFWSLLAPTVAGSVLAGALSFYALERPLIRWGRRGERRAAPVEVTTTPNATSVAS